MIRMTKTPVTPASPETTGKTPLPRSHAKPFSLTGFTLPRSGIFIVIIVAIGLLTIPVSAFTTPDSIVAAGKVYVSDYTIDPAVLGTGETGMATFYITNGNANESVVVNHASFGDKNIRLTSGTYDTSANIGPLQTRPFVFSIATDALPGTYYTTFSLSLRDADSLFYRTPIKVENTPIMLNILNNPDTFTQGKKDTITVQLANPRENDVKNVALDVSGEGITVTPGRKYLGSLQANSEMNATFSVTPAQESVLDIVVNYDNGDNHHVVSLTLPVTFGTDKKKASPQMSNVQVKLDGGVYHVTGDVTNAGLTTANGVSVMALSPAVPQDPYKSYVIGALKPHDFGSYEVTFSADGSSTIPLQISYKDTDGNIVTTREDVSTSAASSAATSNPQGNPLLPAIGIIVVIAIAGVYVYRKRTKNQ